MTHEAGGNVLGHRRWRREAGAVGLRVNGGIGSNVGEAVRVCGLRENGGSDREVSVGDDSGKWRKRREIESLTWSPGCSAPPASRLRDFHPAHVAVMDRLIAWIHAEALASDGGVWVLANVRFAFFCILLSITFGVNLNENSIIRVDEVMKRVLLTIRPRMDDYIPFFRSFFANNQKKVLQVRQEQLDTNPNLELNVVPFSYIDSLLDLKVDGCDSVPTDPELITLCSDLINDEADTTSTAIEWAIALIIDNPDIQDKLYKDIISVVGDRPMDDPYLEKMPYLQAFVKELLWKHLSAYFSLTHAAVEAAKL
ncbi:hypothetical protein Cni_G12818 [Canna indica]|uniref:Cytochrome P450 n=1 Tax=Canna indica TaxID=4628 RepID=A0AAQ3KCU6_9LILI|nr:hypothetical protein Cni_G12818 [Canna indica]